MDPVNEYTPQKDLVESNMTQNYQNRTSFLIEDILYRQKTEEIHNEERANSFLNNKQQMKYDNNDSKLFQQSQQSKMPEKRCENKNYGYFQPNIIQGAPQQTSFQTPDNGYIQVMGALGAYLNTPYKTIADPYFLTQGNFFSSRVSINVSEICDFSGIPFHHALFGSSATEISLNALKHCRRRKARTVFSDPQLTGEMLFLKQFFFV